MRLSKIRKLLERTAPGPWHYRQERVIAGEYTLIGPLHYTAGDNGEFLSKSRTLVEQLLEVAEAAKGLGEAAWDERLRNALEQLNEVD